jgi:cobalt-zinc-cadmium efflux system protein
LKNGHFGSCQGGNCRCEEKRYGLVLLISLLIASFELLGSWISGSLALASDAFHVLVDAAAAAVAIITAFLVRRRANIRTSEKTIRRKGAYISAFLLAVVAVFVLNEALTRLVSPPKIISTTMLAVAVIGCVGNYCQHRILMHAKDSHATQRGLHAHVLTDLWQSLAVVFGAIFVWLTDGYWIDPVLSIVVAFFILRWAIKLVRSA